MSGSKKLLLAIASQRSASNFLRTAPQTSWRMTSKPVEVSLVSNKFRVGNAELDIIGHQKQPPSSTAESTVGHSLGSMNRSNFLVD
ncbi:hypothetical protein RAD15_42525 [Bradyrhizobium sp. 14AA]